MEQAINEYLSHLKIPVSDKYFGKLVASHPEYPSLLSFADPLDRLGVGHTIARLDEEHLDDISFPYMLQLEGNRGKLLLLKDRNDLQAHKKELEYWNGIILKAEPTDTIIDEEHNRQLKKEKLQRKLKFLLGIALGGLFLIPAFLSAMWLQFLLLATTVAGTTVGYLLIAKDLGITYKPIETFCNAGKSTNCDRILNAKDARIFNHFTFTDAAISYFVFQLITAGLFVPLLNTTGFFLWVLAAAAFAALPVIVYSLYYQYAKAKTWCRLCLIVDAILAVQAAIFIAAAFEGLFSFTAVPYAAAAVSLLLFTAIASSLVLLKSKLKAAKTSVHQETAALRVKHDPEVFTHLLFKQDKIDTAPFKQEIKIGDTNAPVKVVIAVNLYCNPCRIAFETITQLLAAHPGSIQFSIRLTAGAGKQLNGHSASTFFIRYWQQHIHGGKDEGKQTQQFLQDWYSVIDAKRFAEKYPINGEIEESNNNSLSLDAQHYEWVKQNGIARTPTFLINGYRMPKNYSIKDFMSITPGLAVLLKEQDISFKGNIEDEIATDRSS